VTGFSATQFAPDPSAGYNFDTYLITPSGKVVPAKHLGGTRYQVFMGSPECPGCHYGRGITIDLHGDPFLLPLADALSMGMGATDLAEWGIGKTTPPAAGAGKSFVIEGGTPANDVLPPNVFPLKRPVVAEPQPGQMVQTGTGGWVFQPGSVPSPTPTPGPGLRIDPITNVGPGGGGSGLPPLLPAPGVTGPAGTSGTQTDTPTTAPKEQRLKDLELRRAETQAKIDELDKQIGKKGGDVGRLAGELKKAQGADRDRVAQEFNARTAERNQLQDQRNQLQTEKDRIQAEVNDINAPPPANPQAGGRAFEKGNVKATGMPKNEQPFETSFGDRKPDHVVTADKDGNWIPVKEIGKADFIAESKLLGRNITLTDQVRGFIELASKTKQKVLLLLTDPGAVISETVHEFARQRNVGIRQMTRVP